MIRNFVVIVGIYVDAICSGMTIDQIPGAWDNTRNQGVKYDLSTANCIL